MFEKIFAPFGFLAFISLIFISVYIENSTSIIWTLLLPALPLIFVVIGFHRWRNICPLAFFSKLNQYNTFIKKYTLPLWFEKNFYLLQFTLLFVIFTLKIYFLNASSLFVTLFFLSLILLSFLSGIFFIGKSWCNYFCPLSLVERIYSVSYAQRKLHSSACSSCSACKHNCPDINLESSYWIEGENAKKKIAFYTFPGMILGYYSYFYLQSGSWKSYFSGDWAHNSLTLTEYLNSSGFFFSQNIPLYIAIILTLLLFSLLSYYLFVGLEKLLHVKKLFRKIESKTVVHRVNVLVAFSAFNIYYVFAGAPYYLDFPFIYTLSHFAIIVLSSTLLYREIFREEKYFLQERFAQSIVKYSSDESLKDQSSKEIYYTYVNHEKDHYRHLEVYKNSINDLLYSGLLNQENESIVIDIQKQFNISDDEHTTIISTCLSTCKDLNENILSLSSEKLFQLKAYKEALSTIIDTKAINESEMIETRKVEFAIKEREHNYIYNELVNKESIVLAKIETLLEEIIEYTNLCNTYHQAKSLHLKYLFYILDENRLTYMKTLKELLLLIYSAQDSKEIVQLIYSNQDSQKEVLLDILNLENINLQNKFIALSKSAQNTNQSLNKKSLSKSLRQLMDSSNEKIVACSLYAYSKEYTQIDKQFDLEKLSHDNSHYIKDIAIKLLKSEARLSLIEKEIYLHKVPLFSKISSHDLQKLATDMQELHFEKSDIVVNESDEGDSLFVITQGSASISVDEDSHEKEVAQIHAGDYIGEIAILSKFPRTASVTALSELSVLELSGESFKRFIIEHPYVSLQLMQEITTRLIQLKS